MHVRLLPLIFLACLITSAAQVDYARVDYDDDLIDCDFDANHPHIAPPDWQGCHELLAGLPIPSRPETVPKIILWPIVLSNDRCTAVIKPNTHPRKPTPGKSVDWAYVHRQATILIFKCFREARPAHHGTLFMTSFLTGKHGFPHATKETALGIRFLSTPYDSATHNIKKSNSHFSKYHLAYSSYHPSDVVARASPKVRPGITPKNLRYLLPADRGQSTGNPVGDRLNSKVPLTSASRLNQTQKT